MLSSFLLLLSAEISELDRQHKYILAKYHFMVIEQGGNQNQDAEHADRAW